MHRVQEKNKKQKQESSINSLRCSRWHLVTKCKWEYCNLQIYNFAVKKRANSKILPPSIYFSCRIYKKYFSEKRHSSCNTCQTSSGSNTIKQHFSLGKHRFHKSEYFQLLQTCKITPFFPPFRDPISIIFFHLGQNQDLPSSFYQFKIQSK